MKASITRRAKAILAETEVRGLKPDPALDVDSARRDEYLAHFDPMGDLVVPFD